MMIVLIVAVVALLGAVGYMLYNKQPAQVQQPAGQNTGRQPLPAPQDPYGQGRDPYGAGLYGAGGGGMGGGGDYPNIAAGFQFGGQVVKTVGDIFKGFLSK